MLRSLYKRIGTRLVVSLSPTRVTVAESVRGWRSRLNSVVEIPCSQVAAAPEWQAPLTTFHDWLEQENITRMDVEIVLSDRFTRYAVIPWSQEVQKHSEMAMLWRIHFESLFGEAAAQWEIQADCSTFGKAGIGCALDKAFITKVQELSAARKLRLISLQPYFVREFNHWRKKLCKEDQLLAVVGSGNCVLATSKKEDWHSIRNFRIGGNGGSDLPVLIKREILLQGLDEQAKIYLRAESPVDIAPLQQVFDVTIFESPPVTIAQPTNVGAELSGGK